LCFGHLHFSEHEKLQCPQLAKAINKNKAADISISQPYFLSF